MRIGERDVEPLQVEEIRENEWSQEGVDGEEEGFETASEGESDRGEGNDSESTEPQVTGLIDEQRDNARDGGSTSCASAFDDVAELEKTLAQVGVTEGESTSEEDAELDREQGILEAKSAKEEGNSLYAESKYVEALLSYERGLSACPLRDPEDSGVKEVRAALYFNRAVCYSNLQNNDAAVKESTKALELNPNYVKALVRRYEAREKLTNYDEAIEDAKRVLELDPGNNQARIALRRLPPLAEEKREKLKKEMIDKLKEAGNSILGRFGMSVDNFKTVQDPNTGSYSIQFQR